MVKEYCERNRCDKEQEERVAKSLSLIEEIKNNQIGLIELDQALKVEWVQEILKRVKSQGKKLSQADFAMSKIAVNERYDGNILRKAIDYVCHFSRVSQSVLTTSSLATKSLPKHLSPLRCAGRRISPATSTNPRSPTCSVWPP